MDSDTQQNKDQQEETTQLHHTRREYATHQASDATNASEQDTQHKNAEARAQSVSTVAKTDTLPEPAPTTAGT